jgi:diaminohydroxyphosphoribosylaminopyrimidine deaminase/5-amino-6-(5-phosphoribosylamino)uracil reductase
MDDRELMDRAYAEAEKCKPITDRIPMVGAVVAVNGTIVGLGHRGTGDVDDDDHAEMNALYGVQDRSQLPEATIYTTLEPCTPEVRSDPLKCCTELIRQAQIKKVYIGILDPNQGVRGKGLWELQERGIEIELFPPDLQKKIRVLNDSFIRTQRKFGIRITDPKPGSTIRAYDKGDIYIIQGDALNEPGDDVIVMTNVGGRWWPQPYRLSVDAKSTAPKIKWTVKVHFGLPGPHSIYILRASDLGIAVFNYYRKITQQNARREEMLRGHTKFQGDEEKRFMGTLPDAYPPLDMQRLPKGLELQDKVDVDVEKPPK